MKKIYILIFIVLYHFGAMAQSEQSGNTDPEFQTDRPNQTQGSSVVPKGFYQAELGFLYEKDKQSGSLTKDWTYPQALFRIGILSKAELRVEATYQHEKSQIREGNQLEVEEDKGVSGVRVGSKVNVLSGSGPRPEMSLLVMAELPWGDKAFRVKHVAQEVVLLLSNNLSDKLQLQYNVGYRRQQEEDHMENDLEYSVSLSDKVTQKLSFFAEVYGEKAPHAHAKNNIDGGLQFMALPNLQLDAIVGTGISAHATDLFVGGGISVRLPR